MTPGYLTILLSILVGVGSGTHLAGAIRAGLSAEGRQTVAVLNAEERADLLSLYSRIDFGPVWVELDRPTDTGCARRRELDPARSR